MAGVPQLNLKPGMEVVPPQTQSGWGVAVPSENVTYEWDGEDSYAHAVDYYRGLRGADADEAWLVPPKMKIRRRAA